MAFEDFLKDKCSIYRLSKQEKDKGFGQKEEIYEYSDVATYDDVSCHFLTNSKSVNTAQQEPNSKMFINGFVTLLQGQDVKINDKIINKENGVEYTVKFINSINGHHKKVEIFRKDLQADM